MYISWSVPVNGEILFHYSHFQKKAYFVRVMLFVNNSFLIVSEAQNAKL